MSDIKEALNQIKQRIKIHELDGTTSNENEREKIILNYINELQDRINKSTDYIEQILEFIISKNIKEEKREYERLEHILNILKGKE